MSRLFLTRMVTVFITSFLHSEAQSAIHLFQVEYAVAVFLRQSLHTTIDIGIEFTKGLSDHFVMIVFVFVLIMKHVLCIICIRVLMDCMAW